MEWRKYKKQNAEKWVRRIKNDNRLLIDPRLRNIKYIPQREACYILDVDNKMFLRIGKNNTEGELYHNYPALQHRNKQNPERYWRQEVFDQKAKDFAETKHKRQAYMKNPDSLNKKLFIPAPISGKKLNKDEIDLQFKNISHIHNPFKDFDPTQKAPEFDTRIGDADQKNKLLNKLKAAHLSILKKPYKKDSLSQHSHYSAKVSRKFVNKGQKPFTHEPLTVPMYNLQKQRKHQLDQKYGGPQISYKGFPDRCYIDQPDRNQSYNQQANTYRYGQLPKLPPKNQSYQQIRRSNTRSSQEHNYSAIRLRRKPHKKYPKLLYGHNPIYAPAEINIQNPYIAKEVSQAIFNGGDDLMLYQKNQKQS